MSYEKHKEYLGDSVYVSIVGDMVRLTTENGGPPSNEILLEPAVLVHLEEYVQRIRQMYAETKTAGDEESDPDHGERKA